jgi:hypothetical protein
LSSRNQSPRRLPGRVRLGSMELTRRFAFHGDACAFSGRIVRPVDIVLESRGSSTLPITGGRLRSHVPRSRFGEFVRFGTATTLAEGVFDNQKHVLAHSLGRMREDELTATTRVNAEVRDAVIGKSPVLRVKRLHASITARSPLASNEPSIKLDEDTTIEGVSIDRYKLLVELNKGLFQKYDTHSKLRVAADDKKFVRDHGHCLLLTTPLDGRSVPPAGQFVENDGTIYGTIVKSLRWTGKPYPGAEIDHHSVRIPNFGRIFFAEIFIGRKWRRLTMMRLKLGSPMALDMAAAEIGANGGWG